jgi:glycosyltransferase involved in cell wall biosynthesis
MRFSIITVTKNSKPGLLRAIECVRNQTYKNVEHIVVDGGSTDGSAEILRSKQKEINSGSVIPANEARQESTADSGLRPNDHTITNPQTATSNTQSPSTNYRLLTISEPDEGIYDAINKGIKLATGDIIGLLHSDDLYADEKVLERYAGAFASDSGPVYTPFRQGKQVRRDFPSGLRPAETSVQPGRAGMTEQVDAVYSDLVYVRNKLKVISQKSKENDATTRNHQLPTTIHQPPTTKYLLPTSYSIIRYWRTQKKEFATESQRHRALKKGWMPPHPTLFIRKEIFEKYGLYNTDLKIASDYDMILRLFYKYKITSHYLPLTTYLMTIGGASNKSIKNIIQKSKEDYEAMKMNGINFPVFTLFSKNLRKLPQFLARDL